MATLLVLYKTPKDPAAFDKHYVETHIPIAKKIPGLRSYAVSKGAIGTPQGPSGLHLIATLKFDSMADLMAGAASPEAAAATADVANFAPEGADLFIFEDAEV